jgi:hypothetical protein
MLLLECSPDEMLARQLGCRRRDYLHLNGKGRICLRLQKSTSQIGLMDEDPDSAQPRYLHKLTIFSEEHDLRCLEDKPRDHRIIVVLPRLEEWIIKTARLAKIRIVEFGLSDRANELHREITSKLPAFEKFLISLTATREARLAHLRTLIRR